MPAENLSLDNAVNARLRSMLHDLSHVDIIQHQPQMLHGGGSHGNQRVALPGNAGQYPPVEMLAELSQSGRAAGGALLGGRQNKVRKQGAAKALRTFGRAVKPLGKNLKPVKAALAARAVRELEGDMPMAQAEVVGGKISRMKKAKKWTDYAENTAYKALDLAQAARSVGGAKPKRTNARAVVVKKVMAEKGLSMIEASKYVKAHNLY